jgi:hypothetical protein
MLEYRPYFFAPGSHRNSEGGKIFPTHKNLGVFYPYEPRPRRPTYTPPSGPGPAGEIPHQRPGALGVLRGRDRGEKVLLVNPSLETRATRRSRTGMALLEVVNIKSEAKT